MQATVYLVRDETDAPYVNTARQFGLIVERIKEGDSDDEVVVSGKKSRLRAYLKHVGWGPDQGYAWVVDHASNSLVETTTAE